MSIHRSFVLLLLVFVTDAFFLPIPPSVSSSALYSRPEWVRKASGVKRTTEETEKMAQSLKRREESLHLVGERFVCRVQDHPVYLFVPTAKEDVEDESNIIYRLEEGEEVVVTGPHRGNWIDHDGGGYSEIVVEGVVALEQLSANSFE